MREGADVGGAGGAVVEVEGGAQDGAGGGAFAEAAGEGEESYGWAHGVTLRLDVGGKARGREGERRGVGANGGVCGGICAGQGDCQWGVRCCGSG